jgi:hypothetical protein
MRALSRIVPPSPSSRDERPLVTDRLILIMGKDLENAFEKVRLAQHFFAKARRRYDSMQKQSRDTTRYPSDRATKQRIEKEMKEALQNYALAVSNLTEQVRNLRRSNQT